ncbi:MAG: S24 family peptidase [Aureispira sp.]|nr:S24 family peptidase [Aureispira sp.]
MGKTDRELLNDRFKKIFQMLEDRGEIVRSDRSKGVSAFAEKILGSRKNGHLVNKYLDGKRNITYEQAKRFCDLYQVNETYMFQGKGEPFLEPDPYELANECATPPPAKTNSIVFSNISAFASSTIDVNVYEDSEHFHIPGMQGEHVAFNINGDSMSPTIANGDMVICRVLDSSEKIHENEIYAIVTNNSVFVKRVQKVYNTKKELTKLKLISDNYLEHDPFTVSLRDVRRLLKVERRLTGLGL